MGRLKHLLDFSLAGALALALLAGALVYVLLLVTGKIGIGGLYDQ